MKVIFILFAMTTSTFAFAVGFEGEIFFTAEQKERHLDRMDQLLKTASDCLRADLKAHEAFHARYGISAFYGDRSSFAKMSAHGKEALLKKLGLPTKLLAQMKPTSCVGLTLKCLEAGLRKTGQDDVWEKLRVYTKLNHQDGTALQNALQKLDWTLHYWNPSPANNEAWDAIEKKKDPDNSDRFWGYHSYRYLTIQREDRYYFNNVDESQWLVNFKTNPPKNFTQIPFFIGTAHTGYHVFPGMFGQVIEGHSTRAITDRQTIESSLFNPLQNGGGPRGQYKSGLMLIPPGFY